MSAQNMNAYGWTPAPKPGLIPLHPLGFGMLLGKPFAALRHNPKVLFGFAIVVQLVIAVVTLAIVGVVAYTSFTRLESLSPSHPDFLPVMWGAIALNAIVIIATSFIGLAFTAVMQGVVAADIAAATLGEKPALSVLWRRMRPALWRLLGWSVLQAVAALVLMAVIGGIIAVGIIAGVGGDAGGVGFAVLFGVLAILAMVPLWVWLSTKLLLVPSVLVLEGDTIRGSLVRSWRLTRRRFWNTFAIIFLVNAIMSTAAGLISVPLSLVGSLLGTVIAPTGVNDASEIIGSLIVTTLPQLLVYALQAITIVVQCAAGVFIYIDSRMRFEGLDHTLTRHVEQRDRGVAPELLGDPFAVDRERAVGRTPPPKPQPAYGVPPVGWAAHPPQAYSPQPYAPQAYAQQPYGGSAPQPAYGQPAPAPQPPYQAPPAPPAAAPPAAPATGPAAPARPIPPTDESPWTAPGSDSA